MRKIGSGAFLLIAAWVGLAATARSSVVIDKFSDRNWSDGKPAEWRMFNNNGSAAYNNTGAVGGDGAVQLNWYDNGAVILGIYKANGEIVQPRRDWSIRTLVRIDRGVRGGVGLSHDESAAPTIFDTTDGDFEIRLRLSDTFDRQFYSDRSFPYELGQFVWVQYDGFGEKITGNLWLPGHIEDRITLSTNRTRNILNVPAVFATFGAASTFEEVWYDTSPIPFEAPEPSGFGLLAMAAPVVAGRLRKRRSVTA